MQLIGLAYLQMQRCCTRRQLQGEDSIQLPSSDNFTWTRSTPGPALNNSCKLFLQMNLGKKAIMKVKCDIKSQRSRQASSGGPGQYIQFSALTVW